AAAAAAARRRARGRRRRAGRSDDRGVVASQPPGTLGAAMTPLEKLVDELERSYNNALERQADPAVYNDHREAAAVGRRLKELEAPVKLAQAWRQARDDLAAARADAELAEMVSDYEADVERLEEELKLSLVERDPADDKDVIVEVRQG